MRNPNPQLYKEFFECNSEEEATTKWKELVEKGYNKWDIYTFRYNGKDGKFHREVFIFNRNNETAYATQQA